MKYAIIILLLFFVGIDGLTTIVPTEMLPKTAIQQQNDDDDDNPGHNGHDGIQPGHHVVEITADFHARVISSTSRQCVDHEASSGLIAFLRLKADKERAK